MLSPEKFVHFFALLCHINFAAMALIIFVFERIQNSLENKKKKLVSGSLYSEFWSDKDFYFSNYKPKNPWDSFKFSLRWIIYAYVIKPIFGNYVNKKKYIGLISRDRFLIRFLPLFLYSGIYCLILLILAGFDAQFKNSHHECTVIHLTLLLASLFYLILYIIFNRYAKSWSGMAFLNIFKICLTLFISYKIIVNLNVAWLHENFLIHNLTFINFAIIFIAIAPIVYLFYSVFTYFFPIWIMSRFSTSFSALAENDMKDRGL